MGGSFLQYPKSFQYEFVKGVYDALNGKVSKNFEVSKKLNETAKHRCVALCIETRPDDCLKYIETIKDFGATRVELGVQIIDDDIYKKINRGHGVQEVVEATKVLKNSGFKIGYHIMPGLPGSNLEKDLKLFKKIFSDEKFKPDQLKIYPCQVMPGSKLEEMYWNKEYVTYTKEEIEKLLFQMLEVVPGYCRIMRIMREIHPDFIIAGTKRIDLRRDLEINLRKKGIKLNEIRYREIGFALRDQKEVNLDLKLKVTKYPASGGEEYFLEIINKDDILFGLLRLRIFEERAIIRELHVYGQSLKFGERIEKVAQHQGLGKWLMSEAEKIVLKDQVKKLKVISGVGVREYYKKLGYKLEEGYMVKKF